MFQALGLEEWTEQETTSAFQEVYSSKEGHRCTSVPVCYVH